MIFIEEQNNDEDPSKSYLFITNYSYTDTMTIEGII